MTQKVKSLPVFNYFSANYDEIRGNIRNREMSWDALRADGSVEESWAAVKGDLLGIRNQFIGVKGKQKNKCKWVTKKCTRLRKAKKSAWIKYQKSNKDQVLYEDYKSKLKASIKENKKAKLDYEQNLADKIKEDCKSFYAYISSKTRSNTKIGPLLDENNDLVQDNKSLADLLNRYFCSVFTKENLSNIPEAEQIFQGNSEDKLSNIVITEQMVLEKLNNLNVNKSLGPDEISGKLLFEIRHELVGPLTKIFNYSISQGIVPQDWRDANVVPLFKKCSKKQCQNYRPVSLTSVVGKILEKIVKDFIAKHLNEHELLKDSQHGFTSGRSCLTNLLEFLETVTSNLDEGKDVDLVYLDFAKAFDKVSHIRLYKKLEAHGITDPLLGWVKAWLNDRRQKVLVDGKYSNWGKVTSGVPQGSVLGPVLFLIYINDIDSNLVSKIGKFADDSKLLKVIESNTDVINLREDLKSLENWSDKWQMQFNIEKCSVMHIGKSNPCSEYKLYDKVIKSSEQERDLGVIVDKTLKFSEHCNRIANSANLTLGLIKRNIVSRDKKIITKLYKALVRPKLEYCVQAWRPFLKKDIEKLESVQRRATKLISGCRGLSYEDRLKMSGLVTLEDRRNRGDMIEVYKMLHGKNRVDYSNFVKLSKNIRTRGHSLKLEKSRSRLNIRKNFFSQRVINKWNELPEVIINASSVNNFKNLYDKHYHRS